MDAPPAAVGLSPSRFAAYVAANIGLYALGAVVWGIPVVAAVGEFSHDDGPPLLAATWLTLFAVAYLGIFVFIPIVPLIAYLAVVYPLPRRRVFAVLLSPIAVTVFFFLVDGKREVAGVALAGMTYAASIWFPDGPAAWWQERRRVLALGLTWILTLAVVGLLQQVPAGVESDVLVTVRQDDRTARYRLACEYDRGGRLRGAAVYTTHPGGRRACEHLDAIAEGVFNGPPELQDGCLPNAPVATYAGNIRGRQVALDVIRGPCEADWFAADTTGALVPTPR